MGTGGSRRTRCQHESRVKRSCREGRIVGKGIECRFRGGGVSTVLVGVLDQNVLLRLCERSDVDEKREKSGDTQQVLKKPDDEIFQYDVGQICRQSLCILVRGRLEPSLTGGNALGELIYGLVAFVSRYIVAAY